MKRQRLALLGLLLVGSVSRSAAQSPGVRFDHTAHRKLFPSCETCHAGAATPGQAIWPAATGCASCHDGTIQKAVDWQPPPPRPTLLRFTHAEHGRRVREKSTSDSLLTCMTCHAAERAPWMQITRSELPRCLGCHGVKVDHLEAPDTACATCHRSLPEATELSRQRIAAFRAPLSHEVPGFTPGGHGTAARPVAGDTHHPGIATSCATCHARDFCTQCHVNAPETPTIMALAPDPRSRAIVATLKAPEAHADQRFQARHGGQSRARNAACATCHTQESCVSCHRSNPAVVATLPRVRADRGIGAVIHRKRPDSHTPDFADAHGPLARATAGTCSGCHARTECLECHRPNAGASGGYHQAGFLSRHPSAAYNRQADCNECHNPSTFCTSCHTQSGLTSSGGLLQGNYHDAGGTFLLSHGAAARRGLESCVTCHSERDCLACHSAQTRRFSPHGPGFDAERLRRRNPQTCAACHGQSIPRGP